jgi:hypothetical protein
MQKVVLAQPKLLMKSADKLAADAQTVRKALKDAADTIIEQYPVSAAGYGRFKAVGAHRQASAGRRVTRPDKAEGIDPVSACLAARCSACICATCFIF